MVKKQLVPPDGGWGWVIMFAYALYNLVFIPIMQNFGLIFKDTFSIMGMSATDGSIIITSNAALGMMMGLVNGPLLKRYSCRKASIFAAFLIIAGVTLTAFATTFFHLLITYGLITSIGMGIGMSSYPLALNSYFVKKRNKATGFAFTITGLGPILMSQLISFLLSFYTVQGTMLILGGISAHTLAAALLLQPVEWHMKEVADEVDEEKMEDVEQHEGEKKIKNEEDGALLRNGSTDFKRELSRLRISRANSVVGSNLSIDHDADTQSIYGFDATPRSRVSSTSSGGRRRSISTSDTRHNHFEPIKNKWWSSTHSVASTDVENPTKLFDEHERVIPTINEEQKEQTTELIPASESIYNPNLSVKIEEKNKSPFTKFFHNVVHFFDLSLLQDPIYVNIMMGMSLAIFAELNFSLLTPFILSDIGLDTQQIATFISVLSSADLLFRFLAPFIGDYLKQDVRIMYMFSMVLLVITRFSLLLFSSYTALLTVSIGLGVAKGIRTVYMTLVIPNYVPLERLAAASGLQMMVNGILIVIGGPLLGVIRDITGSYTRCIYVINCVTITTMLMWTIELLYCKCRNSSKNNEAYVEKG